MAKRKKKAAKSDSGYGYDEPTLQEAEEGEEEEFTGTVHEFAGEALPVQVGDIFSLKSNPGIQDEVTEEVLADLVRRKKALSAEEIEANEAAANEEEPVEADA